MEREQIIKALECCKEGDNCLVCPYDEVGVYSQCIPTLLENALSLIKSQEQKIFELENRLKECENGYGGTLYLESCKLHDAEEKVKKLTEENERLRADNEILKMPRATIFEIADAFERGRIKGKADTVHKFAEKVKALFAPEDDVQGEIDQIANEIVKGEKANDTI